MKRIGRLFSFGLLACLLVSCNSSALALDSPYAGRWTVTVLSPGADLTLLLVEVVEKASGPKATLLSAGVPALEDAKVEAVRDEDEGLRITVRKDSLEVTFVAHPPRGEAKPKTMLGYGGRLGQWDFARWERTDQKEIDRTQARVEKPEVQHLDKALKIINPKDKIAALQEFLSKHPADVLAFFGRIELITVLIAEGAPETEVRQQADKVFAFAAEYGPPMKLRAFSDLARRVLASGQLPQVALDFARQAEKTLSPSASEAEQVPVLKILARALRKAGKAAEAGEVTTRIAQLDDALDKIYLKEAIPFRPERFAGREGSGNRVVLVELFTGVQCPPCVAADVAFDALLKSYTPQDVVFLQYHMHIPGPDPLTNPDNEKRAGFYGLKGTPTIYVNGKEGPPVGGLKADGKNAYENLVDALKEPLQTKSPAALKVAARRDGDNIDIIAEVSKLEKQDEEVRLRLVLVEEMVRFPGRNGQRLHHHVVRGFLGGLDGWPLKEAGTTQKVRVSLKDLAGSLRSYLGSKRFDEDDQPLELKNLKVVALIQDSKSKAVLQAAQVDLSGGDQP